MKPSLSPTLASLLACAVCASSSLLVAQADTARARTVAQVDTTASRLVAPPTLAWARVTYISGQSAYIDAGTKDGLKEGSPLTVARAGEPVARLVVEFISTTRASCKVVSSTEQVAVGDSVRFTPVPTGLRAAEATLQIGSAPPPPPPRPPAPKTSPSVLRGRVGLRYLMFDAGVGGALLQPAIDLRLDGQHLGGSPFGLAVDARAQRAMSTSSALSAAGANVTRVYQAALIYNPLNSPLRLAVGRQFASTLPTVGLLDGATLDFNYPRWGFGAFGGDEPDIATMGLSSVTHEFGTYVQLHSVRGRSPLWSFTLGGVGAYNGSQIDREFGILQATYNSRRFSVFATQELDLNRGWKATVEPALITPTSSFVTVMVSLSDALSVNGGYDNRRNVRLYRDFVNPEITFDDSFREGEWGGASLFVLGHIRASGDVRLSAGGPAGNSQSNTASLSVVRLTPLQLAAHVRSTTFTGTLANGSLRSVSLEMNPWGVIRIEGSTGTRDSSRPLDATSATHISWTGIDVDFGVGRSIYMMLSTYRENGTNDHTLQSFVSLSYRF
jgi:hypothetical protein